MPKSGLIREEEGRFAFTLVKTDQIALVAYGIILLAGFALNFVAYDWLSKARTRLMYSTVAVVVLLIMG